MGYEQQQAGLTLMEPGTAIPPPRHSLQLNGKGSLPPDDLRHKVKVEYISFLTSDGQPHLACVATVNAEKPKVVSYVSGGMDSTRLVVVKLETAAELTVVETAVHAVLKPTLDRFSSAGVSIQVHQCQH